MYFIPQVSLLLSPPPTLIYIPRFDNKPTCVLLLLLYIYLSTYLSTYLPTYPIALKEQTKIWIYSREEKMSKEAGVVSYVVYRLVDI
jgi:hypothetical protein